MKKFGSSIVLIGLLLIVLNILQIDLPIFNIVKRWGDPINNIIIMNLIIWGAIFYIVGYFFQRKMN